MNKKYFIEWEGQLRPLKKWILQNNQLINGYVYNEKDITHRIEDKLEQLGWNSIYDDVNHWQILTLRESTFNNLFINKSVFSQSGKEEVIGKLIIENGIVNKEKFIFHSENLNNSFDLDWLEEQMVFLNEEIRHFELDKMTFENKGGFNKFIREKIDPIKLGCYIFSTPKNEEILYIGMAGKLKTNGQYSNHSIYNRLQASRTKDTITKKEINTEEYLKYLLDILNKEKLRISVMYVKNDVPSGYLEAVLLYQFYKRHGVLPLLNNAF
jgi:hypothetical protein